jgi:hypothetical protein
VYRYNISPSFQLRTGLDPVIEMCPQINKPKLKFFNNLGLDSLSPNQELDPRVSPEHKAGVLTSQTCFLICGYHYRSMVEEQEQQFKGCMAEIGPQAFHLPIYYIQLSSRFAIIKCPN